MKKNIAVIFGGKSAEHDVSIITAHVPIIESLLADDKFNVVPIYIAKNGKWYSDQKMLKLEYFRENLDEKLSKLNVLGISLNDGFRIIKTGPFPKKVKIDVVFPAMHGTYGEDGSLMGLLRLGNVPFVGCDLSASAVAMDKSFTKQVCQSVGLPIVPFVSFTKSEWEKNNTSILNNTQELSFPLFVKPVHLGSSIGMTKVRNTAELENAIEVALHYDDKVLVEESIENLIEVTLPIMGNDEVTLGSIERPLNKSEFFDFEDKYIGEGKKSGGVNNNYSEIPAKISDELSQKVLEYGEKTYKTVGCSGISRIDFLIDSNNETVYVNEINTLPGGLYDHNWRKTGISNIELVNKLIDFAIERFERQTDLTHTFSSDILKVVNGPKLNG